MTKRLFLGIAPDNSQLAQLAALQQQLGSVGRPVKPANLHMTLFFLGTVDDEMAQAFESAIDGVSWPKFKVTLDSLKFWRKPKIICLTGEAEDSKLKFIAASIRQIATNVGLAEPHFGFTPHITLMRKAKNSAGLTQDQLPPWSLTLIPKMIHLFQSVSGKNGVEYHIISSWQLA